MTLSNSTIRLGMFLLVGMTVAGFALLVWSDGQNANAEALLKPNEVSLVESGMKIYQTQCATCHGENLEGQPDWQTPDNDGLLPAPPHDKTGHTWHHADNLLFNLTKFGIAEIAGLKDHKTSMPIYEEVLDDAEIIAVLSYIKSTWPKAIRDRHDQLNQRTRKAK
ncbi:MAG: cytochrome c [Rhizobiaceae bacterium]|nr:cytochrome c [Rhizobiaceae bacterium]